MVDSEKLFLSRTLVTALLFRGLRTFETEADAEVGLKLGEKIDQVVPPQWLALREIWFLALFAHHVFPPLIRSLKKAENSRFSRLGRRDLMFVWATVEELDKHIAVFRAFLLSDTPDHAEDASGFADGESLAQALTELKTRTKAYLHLSRRALFRHAKKAVDRRHIAAWRLARGKQHKTRLQAWTGKLDDDRGAAVPVRVDFVQPALEMNGYQSNLRSVSRLHAWRSAYLTRELRFIEGSQLQLIDGGRKETLYFLWICLLYVQALDRLSGYTGDIRLYADALDDKPLWGRYGLGADIKQLPHTHCYRAVIRNRGKPLMHLQSCWSQKDQATQFDALVGRCWRERIPHACMVIPGSADRLAARLAVSDGKDGLWQSRRSSTPSRAWILRAHPSDDDALPAQQRITRQLNDLVQITGTGRE